jgi:hypothetical protein
MARFLRKIKNRAIHYIFFYLYLSINGKTIYKIPQDVMLYLYK